MMELDGFSRSEKVGLFVLVIVLLLLPVSVALNFFSEDFALAGATTILALITLWYATTNRQLLEQQAKQRHRGYVKRIIHSAIDAMNELMNENEGEWAALRETPAGAAVFPDFMTVNIPYSLLQDLKEDYPEIGSLPDRFLEKHRMYHRQRVELRRNLEDEILQMDLELPENIDELVPPELEGRGHRLDPDKRLSPRELIDDDPGSIAYYVIENPPDPFDPFLEEEGSLDRLEYRAILFDQFRSEFLEIRSREEFSGDFEELKETLEELREIREELAEQLAHARQDYMKKYDIMETELMDLRDEYSRVM